MLYQLTDSTSRRRLASAAVLACLVALLAFAGSAQAARNIVTGFADPVFRSPTEADRLAAFNASDSVGAEVVRLDVIWSSIAPNQPANPTDPADPAYDFSGVDEAVREAHGRGLDILFTVYNAPAWAEGPGRPPVSHDLAPAGTWKPNPADYGAFGTALATRFSGNYTPATGGAALPAVTHFEAWNEENLWAYLAPQYDGKTPELASHYRALLNAFYDAIHKVDDNAKVLLGGNAPYGDPPGGIRTRPIDLLRQLFCLTRRLEPTSCPEPVRFDILGVHPINLSGGPTQSAINDDDATSADVANITKVLRAAEEAKTIEGGRHRIWATEFWWESFPDGGATAKPGLAKHGIWIEQALYLFWKAKVDVALNLQVLDTPAADAAALNATYQTGVFLADGTPKPAATAFRFPFVLERKSKSSVFAWGKSPEKGKLTIAKQQGGGWRKVETLNVKRNKVFTATLELRGKGKYRATIGDDASLVWSLRK